MRILVVVVHSSYVDDYRKTPRGRLTAKCHGYIIDDKSYEDQDVSLRIGAGIPIYNLAREVNTVLRR
jgi:hypothetical protein